MNDTAQAPWKVVVVEDNHATRSYLESCIKDQPQLTLAASFSTLAPAQAWFDLHPADLLLVDLGLPDGSGLSLMRQVRRQCPGCDMLVVSMFGDEENVVASIEAGAVGYVHKDDDAADIAETLKAVKQGASPISPMIARHLLRRMQPGGAVSSDASRAPRPAPTLAPQPADVAAADVDVPEEAAEESAVVLSRREQEVLEYIARGFSYAEIAREQGITVHTVQTYIKKLYGKLAVHSRSEAVFQANRLGLLNTFGQQFR